MQQLDEWSDKEVVDRLLRGEGEFVSDETIDQVKSAIRQKVLESYRNGQAAPAGVKSQAGNFRPRRQSSK